MIISAHSQGVKDATNGAILKAKSVFIYGLLHSKTFWISRGNVIWRDPGKEFYRFRLQSESELPMKMAGATCA